MNEARCVLVDFHTALNQILIIGAGYGKYIPFIRYMWYKDADINTVFSSQQQCCFHFVINHKIRRSRIDIAVGTVDHIDMRVFPDIFLIRWRIAIRLNIAVTMDMLKLLKVCLLYTS